MLNKQQRRNMLFFLIYHEHGKTQQKIADFFEVSQSTVALGLKEAKYLYTIKAYEQEIENLRAEITGRMGLPPSNMPLIDIDKI